jgi:hypothetical protein
MTKGQLMESTRQLRAPSAAAVTEFESRQEQMAAELIRYMRGRPDLDRLIGRDNGPMMENNSRNMLRFMASLFRGFEPAVLAETALWVFRAYRAHGFTGGYWPAHLDATVRILKDALSTETFAEIYPSFEWLIVNIPGFVELSDAALGAGPSHDQNA